MGLPGWSGLIVSEFVHLPSIHHTSLLKLLLHWSTTFSNLETNDLTNRMHLFLCDVFLCSLPRESLAYVESQVIKVKGVKR